MRSLLGLVLLNGLALVLGTSILLAAGLVSRRAGSLLPAAGAALLAGLAALALGATLAVVAGLGMSAPAVAAAAVVASLALGAIGLRRGARDDGEPGWPAGRAGWLPPAVIVAFVALQLLASRDVPVAWDAAHNWTLKAIALASNGRLEGRLFTDAQGFTASHLDYPLLQPVLGALAFRFGAATENGLLLGQLWILLGATVLAVPWLVRGGRLTWLAAAPMALVMVAAPTAGLLRGDADVTVACLAAAGAVALARALETGRGGYAALGALWLGAAANTKNEGLAFAAAVLVAALAVSLARRPRRPVPILAAAGAVIALAVPWRLWVRAHGPFNSDVAPLSDSLDPGYLADRLHHLDLGAQAILGQLVSPGALWIAPAFLAVAGAAIVSRRMRTAACVYLGGLVLAVLAVVWVYWTSQQPDVPAHIERTSIRTVTGPLFLAAAGLAHLLPRLVRE